MKLSYRDLMATDRTIIEATITTDHSASSYGIPVIVLKDGEALDYNSAILLDYQVEEVSEEEAPLLDKWRKNMPPVNTMAARALGSRGGKKGGRSRSPAKIAAARENGKKGGRPRGKSNKSEQ